MELIIDLYFIQSIPSLHALFIIQDMWLLWYWLEVVCRNTENLFRKRLKRKNIYDSYKNVLSIVFLQKTTVYKPEKHKLLWSHVSFQSPHAGSASEWCRRKQRSPWSSKMARRRTQGITGQSASPQSLERLWRPCVPTGMTRKWSGVVITDSLKVNHVWPVRWPSTVK